MVTSSMSPTTTEATTFQNEPTLQKLSPLIGLPAELRLKIMRYLLRSGDPIRSQKEVGEAGYRAITCLSSQILQTCQQVYKEASVILYHKNTLAVKTGSYDSDRNPHCPTVQHSFLGVTVLAQSNMKYGAKSLMLPLLQDLVERKKHTELLEPSSAFQRVLLSIKAEVEAQESRALDSWIEAYGILARFHKFHVVLDLDSANARDDALLFFRRFHAAFSNKDVVVTVVPKTAEDTSILAACLLRCRVLRCRSLRFELPATIDVNEIVRTVTSQEPMLDTYSMACLLRRNVIEGFGLCARKDFLGVHGNLWSELLDRASEYDFELYQKLRESLLETARDWTPEYERRRLRDVKKDTAKFEKLIAAASTNHEMGAIS